MNNGWGAHGSFRRTCFVGKGHMGLVESVTKCRCIFSLHIRKSNSTFPDFAAGLTPKSRRKTDRTKKSTYYFIF